MFDVGVLFVQGFGGKILAAKMSSILGSWAPPPARGENRPWILLTCGRVTRCLCVNRRSPAHRGGNRAGVLFLRKTPDAMRWRSSSNFFVCG